MFIAMARYRSELIARIDAPPGASLRKKNPTVNGAQAGNKAGVSIFRFAEIVNKAVSNKPLSSADMIFPSLTMLIQKTDVVINQPEHKLYVIMPARPRSG
jgi:hypothetical protein